MATNEDPAGTPRDGEPGGPVKSFQVPAAPGPAPFARVPKAQVHQASSLQTSPPAIVVVTAKVADPGGPKPVLSQTAAAAAVTPTSAQRRTVVITVPRSAGPPLPVAPQLPANIHIPPGMVLIRSDGGQLMLMSRQALAQVQQGARSGGGPAGAIPSPQVRAPPGPSPRSSSVGRQAAAGQSGEKVTMLRMPTSATFRPAALQNPAVVKVIGPAAVPTRMTTAERGAPFRPVAVVTKKEPPPALSQETLESVKKCKNFLVTLMKLASSDSKSANMATNVRDLVRNLLEGKMEADEFTEALYRELKSTPQPCLVPFLKKSLPAVRRLTADPQAFIQQACCSSSVAVKNPNGDPASSPKTLHQSSGASALPQSRTLASKSFGTTSSPGVAPVQLGKPFAGGLSVRPPLARDPPCATRLALGNSSASSYKEDDDINDVASMAGVNLREENAQILTGAVGSVVRSCQDQLFLSAGPALGRILRAGRPLGVTEVGPEVVALVSHATQECLRGLLEKLTVTADHRKAAPEDDLRHDGVSDVRSQLRFLEEVDALKKKRKDEEEKDRLMRLARSRSHPDDPLQQQLRQRAKEVTLHSLVRARGRSLVGHVFVVVVQLQQMEEAQLQQREANLTALAAIGPRKKKAPNHTGGHVRPTAPQAARESRHAARFAAVHGAQPLPAPLAHLLQGHAVTGPARTCNFRLSPPQNPPIGFSHERERKGRSVRRLHYRPPKTKRQM
ncbi:transcription initiation factor TFIID subunit 4-like isoform X3 [Syngnathoides biaculeatus]|uniref:transcription initiation factor TFIID subunit 4-like isoform X3 n=1 Tax=Syngnathoides biaculeatus TaxID=300417 RepID=UPI002ADDBAD6|nr:transcription initiation factor TFIID subunit 4-like isoform X3 [Syngnathoides biaculeatus]